MPTLHLTVRPDRADRAAGPVAGVDVRLHARPGAVVADALPVLGELLGLDRVLGASLAGRRLDGDHRLGDPPLLDGVTLTLVTQPGEPSALLHLRVGSGPLPPRRIRLAAGRWLVGRGASAPVRLADPDVSRLHAELIVRAGPAGDVSCTVRDLGSTNGTELVTGPEGGWCGRQVGPDPVPFPVGSRLVVGSSTLFLDRPEDPAGPDGHPGEPAAAQAPASVHADGSGSLRVNRAPRVPGAGPPAAIDYPAEPPEPARAKLPWPAFVLPLLVAVPVALLWHQPTFLILAAASPLLALGQFAMDRRSRRGELARATAQYRLTCDRLDAELAQALAADCATQHAHHPGPVEVTAAAGGPGERLWQRSPNDDDFLALRLGQAELPSRVPVRRARVEQPPPPGRVPLVVPMRSAAVVGICGPDDARRALGAWLLGQAAVWHSPHELRMVVLSSGEPGALPWWQWSSWLPHADPRPPAASDRGGGERTHTLVVLDGAAELRRLPAVADLLAHGPGRGVVLLCLARDRAELPVECTAVAAVEDQGAVLELPGHPPQPFDPDLPGRNWSQRLGRHLAPLRDATPEPGSAAPPPAVRLVDLIAVDVAGVAEQWLAEAQHRDRLPAVIGDTGSGPLLVDLARDGPHALVAGTTGAGKSELLTTLVAALATRLPPHRLGFLLVDYKGGTALRRLAELPHVTGVITDLDARAAQRALASLRAELRRRERWLAEDAARRAVDLPRLVIIVDEFRVLAEEQPELLAGLVRVATVGRGLGVHLVLATQRPAGVVSPDIRANANLRIALRLHDRTDSVDVLDLPDAADLPAEHPGRGILRVGNGPAVTFQTAHLPNPPPGREPAPAASAAEPVTATVITGDPTTPTRRLGPAGSTDAGPDPLPADLDHLLICVQGAARLLGSAPAPAPWLEPLPARIEWAQLWRTAGGQADPRGGPRAGLPFAVADLPEQQARAVLHWDLLRDGHLAVIGGPSSGRTTLLRTIAAAAESAVVGELTGPGPGIHVHAIDAGGGVAGLAGLAGRSVGTVVAADDLDRARRLVELLAAEVRRRRSAPGRADPGPRSTPVIVLLVDGWESLEETWAGVDHGRTVEELLRLARDGSGVGIRLAVTGGRALLGSAPGAVLTERLLLGNLDPMVALLAGVPADRLPRGAGERSHGPPTGTGPGGGPGRLVRLVPGSDPVEAQAVLPRPPGPATGSAAGEPTLPAERFDPARRIVPEADGASGPLRLTPLPDQVDPADLVDPADPVHPADPGLAVIGVGGDDARPVGLPLGTARGALVCAGPAGGRSTALATLARSAAIAGRPVVLVTGSAVTGLLPASPRDRVGPRLEVVRQDFAGPTGPAGRARSALAELAGPTGSGDSILLLDDGWADLPGVEELALERLTTGTGLSVVACAMPAEASLAFRGLLSMLRATRTGLLLGPRGPTDGDCLGVRLAPAPAGPPGRGVLVVSGQVQPVQVAGPDPLGRPDTLGRALVDPAAAQPRRRANRPRSIAAS